VSRENTFEGPQTGIAANGGVPYAPRDATRDTDVYRNECVRIVDDCVEPENAAVNWRVWENRIHKTTVMVSTSPIHYGPMYVFRNQAWDLGATGSGFEATSGRARVSTSVILKSGGLNLATKHVRPILYWVHNTVWTDVDGSGGAENADLGSGGLDATINGQNGYNAVQYVRNNVVRNTRFTSRVGQGDVATNWDEDYNVFVSRPTRDFGGAGTSRESGMRIEGGINGGHQIYDSTDASDRQAVSGQTLYTLADYRADLAGLAGRPRGYGNGEHTNRIGSGGVDVAFASPADGSGAVAALDRLLADPRDGDLTPRGGANPLVDGGVPIPNISDRPGVDYRGAGPDLGAVER
jgi:hypothetical protein